jgi:dual specificity tyrosine-phosphorylation-regulated kinase 1
MKIVEVLGMPPNHILEQGTKTKRFFDRLPDNTWIPRKSKERRVRKKNKIRLLLLYLFSIEHQVHVNYMI